VTLASKAARLCAHLQNRPSWLIALSGGVDSAVLLALAARARPGAVGAATARSAAVPAEEVEEAARMAALCGVPHFVVETGEVDDPRYRANDGKRCYFCRQAMYGGLSGRAAGFGYAAIADGLQADDLVADRPGVAAAREHGIEHPLRDAGLSKREVRRLAWGLGLPVHDKPAQPCLASRLPVGVEVTRERLARVHDAETALRAFGYRELRVRCERSHARVEIGTAELARAFAEEARVLAAVVAAGFATAALDPRGYGVLAGRSGVGPRPSEDKPGEVAATPLCP